MKESDEVPSRLRREDCFFGLHFDLHPNEKDAALGAEVTEENVGELLDRVKPDFVQYDCKGHRGYTGYPSKVGWPAPGIVADSLAVWRQVTRRRGIALFIHYSGVLDGVALENHPEWAALDADGKPYPNGQVTSTFGPYVDELLIPQMIEAIQAYDLDGTWVDGESWGVELDYTPAAIEQWRKQTGHDKAPKCPEDPHWLQWKNFHRDRFDAYLCHWIDAVHAACPDAQLCSNWMYSIAAPRPVTANVDYLSGDYSPFASADTGRRQARYLAATGMPWDLMSWGFIWHGDYGRSLKPAVQVQQEAGTVLMQGGGFQIYHKPTRSGYITEDIIRTAEQVAAFCRARQAVSHKSTSVPQVALLFSTETLWDRCQTPFDPEPAKLFDELQGMLHALLELHYSVDILAEHQLRPRLAEFPLVVIPHAHKLAPGFREALLEHVERGGSLMLAGSEAAGLFEGELGVEFKGEPAQTGAALRTPAGAAHVNGVWQGVALGRAEVIASRYPTSDTRKGAEPASTIASRGKGLIGAIYGPASLAYFRTHHPFLRVAIGELAGRLFPDPAVKVDAPACVDIALRRTADGRDCLHLLNLSSAQRAEDFIATDHIPPVGPIAVRLKLDYRPKGVQWVPDGGKLTWQWRDGRLSVTIPHLHIHGVLVADR